MSIKAMTRDEINQHIAEITACLKGPMSNVARALMVADRTDLRLELIRREGEPTGGPGPMSEPIDYLAFVEWPCKPTRWNDGESGFECAGCIVTVQTTPTRLEHAAHLEGCRIAQRNAALQAAHAMQQELAERDKIESEETAELAKLLGGTVIEELLIDVGGAIHAQPSAAVFTVLSKLKADAHAMQARVEKLEPAVRAMMKRWITMGPWPFEEARDVQDILDGMPLPDAPAAMTEKEK